MRDPTKGRAALRRGRVSIPQAEYFVTRCTNARRPGLTSPVVASAILAEMRSMDGDATRQLRCAVVMPDHIHMLFILGERLALGKCVARLKSKAKSTLAFSDEAAMPDWERDFFDRHIRPDDDRRSLFLSIFLKAYRAGLCARTTRWPWYFCRGSDGEWFGPLLDEDRPVPEWMED